MTLICESVSMAIISTDQRMTMAPTESVKAYDQAVEKGRQKKKGSTEIGAQGSALKTIREQRLMSKAELARKAGVSPLTIDRIESGKDCRMETKRKIILALGFSLDEKDKIFF